MKPELPLKVGELAARAGVGVQTLHYYERLGLLPKPERSAANHRVYAPETLRRVQFIKKAQAVGFTLEEIKEVFRCGQRGAQRCRHVAELGEKRLRELDEELEMLQAFRNSLALALPKWNKENSSRQKCAGEFCDLIEGLPVTSISPAELKRKLRRWRNARQSPNPDRVKTLD